MKYIIINLSPRQKGTSKMLVNYIAGRIEDENNKVEKTDLYLCLKDMDSLMEKIKQSDRIVMIGPCYVNSFPAETINLLSIMAYAKGALHGQSLYGFIQGGMPYTHTHEHGIKLLESFAAETGLKYNGGFVMGGGAILDGKPLEKIIGAKRMVPAVNRFIEHIKRGEKSDDELYKSAAMKFPPFLTRVLVFVLNMKVRQEFRKKGVKYKTFKL